MKIVLYIAKKYSIPIFKPLVRFLDSSDHDYMFYLSDKVKKDLPKEWSKSKILENLRSAKKYNSDFVLSSGNFVDFRIPGIKVQIFHGLGVEKPAHFKIRHFFDLYLTSGPFVTEKFMELREDNNRYFEVRETGWLKIDYILGFDKDSYNYNIDIPSDKKIILYAPTFSNKMESASQMIGKIKGLISKDEFWILKFHELMDKEVVAHFKREKNILVVENYDITPYLHIADIMISDTSSVVYEFMALNKPVITIDTIS
ncbi:MAG: CDP-glycerol--glycerophosphate glycerophosphotransferase, partial [Candidatus Cloacimonadota bacterium]